MSLDLRRRDFLKLGTAALTVSACVPSAWSKDGIVCNSPTAARIGWSVGVQQYTFRSYSFYEMLDMMAELGVQHAETCFFLALDKSRPELKVNENLTPAVRAEVKQKLADCGAVMSTFYSNLATDADQAQRIFAFCGEMGAKTIVAEPPAEAFDMIEKLCDEYDIRLAVHNHPRSPSSKYWDPDSVLAVCQGRGTRIGACCDTGHWVRSGLDPVQCLKKMEGRILGFHLKDVAEWGKPESRDVPLGEGKANYAAVLQELKRQNYRGVMTIEYEHDSPELLADVAKCVAFVEQTAKTFVA